MCLIMQSNESQLMSTGRAQTSRQNRSNAMGIGGQREGAEASVEKQYVHTNVIDTLEVTCSTRVRTRVTQAECLPS